MARAIWSGSVSFGLVNVPVGLYSATEDHDVHFHQFEKGTSSRIRNERVNEDTGDEVDYKDIVKGAEISDGEYVMLTQEELESVEPGKSRTIDISDFVDAAEIDPIFYQKSYYLAPKDDTAKKPYTLLVKAMAKAERIGVATFVMRGKQYLAAIRPQENVLVLETMFFADEVRDPAKEIDQLPTRSKVGGKDLDMAVKLIKTLTAEWKPKNYRDTYTERVEKLIDAKKKNREIVVPESSDEDDGGKVVDLLEALQASLDGAKKHKPGNTHDVAKLKTRKADDDTSEKKSSKKTTGKKKTASKKTAKKSTAKKSTAKKTAKKSTAKKTAKKSTAKKTRRSQAAARADARRPDRPGRWPLRAGAGPRKAADVVASVRLYGIPVGAGRHVVRRSTRVFEGAAGRGAVGRGDGTRRRISAGSRVPGLTWGRDELGLGDMWNSNSLVAWLLATSGHDVESLAPPGGGRAPGWTAGLELARRTGQIGCNALGELLHAVDQPRAGPRPRAVGVHGEDGRTGWQQVADQVRLSLRARAVVAARCHDHDVRAGGRDVVPGDAHRLLAGGAEHVRAAGELDHLGDPVRRGRTADRSTRAPRPSAAGGPRRRTGRRPAAPGASRRDRVPCRRGRWPCRGAAPSRAPRRGCAGRRSAPRPGNRGGRGRRRPWSRRPRTPRRGPGSPRGWGRGSAARRRRGGRGPRPAPPRRRRTRRSRPA